jgi:uncharacterized cupredoxin-like copper-binding protein
MKFLLSALGVLALLALGAVASGCGSSDSSSTSTTSSSSESEESSEAPGDTTAAAGAMTVTVKMDEYKFMPDKLTVKSGSNAIEAENVGDMPHELVIAKSDLDPAKLPTTSDGSVDEEALDVIGETGDVEPGQTGVVNADLEPGSYVMICNLPGHYAGGMYGSLTVK